MIQVDVCVCTYRRESLSDTLKSIAMQCVSEVGIRVIVADNDECADRRETIERLGKNLGLNLLYVHAPCRNISVARNACLDAATGDWMAFIDDDEIAAGDWLARLLSSSPGHEVVFGISEAIYGHGAPDWIVRGDFHSNRMGSSQADWNGYTSNALINRAFWAQARTRFAERLGQTGGEDTLFFFELKQAGARFAYEPDAVVTEPTGEYRASFKWLFLRRFRSGQTYAMILRREGRIVGGSAAAVAKLLWSAAMAACTLPVPHISARHFLRGTLHAGVIAGATGLAAYREYGPPASRAWKRLSNHSAQ